MRIIDKNTDYYDYLQNSDDPIVFDRRGSKIITKDDFGYALHSYMNLSHYGADKFPKEGFMLLQCGATYWLFLVTVSGVHSNYPTYWNDIADYSLELISTWKNYDRPREIIHFELIDFGYKILDKIEPFRSRRKKTFREFILSRTEALQDAINHNDLSGRKGLFGNNPILTACGIKDLISPEDIFMAIEEHFSLLKTESERIDPIGATNNDKITMHGFDTKTSFRRKQKGTAV